MIGKGFLKLEPYFIETENERWNIEKARALLEKTLLFYPLNNIFYVSNIRIIQSDRKPIRMCCVYRSLGKHEERIGLGNPSERISLNEIKRETGSEAITVIWKGEENCYIPEQKIIYVDPNPIILAHELGHLLGLRDEYKVDYYDMEGRPCCVKDSVNRKPARYIMECPEEKDCLGFSKENIEKLTKEYL